MERRVDLTSLHRAWSYVLGLLSTRVFRSRAVDYQSLFENSVVGIFRLDSSAQRFVVANPAMARILGYESPRQLCESAVPVGDALFVESSARDRFLEMCSNGEQREIEAEVYGRDGSKRWILMAVVGTTTVDPQRQRAYHDGVLYDITARKRAQSSLRRLSARLLQLQDEERRRLARELHDSTGQDLAALEMNLVQLEASARARLQEEARTTLSGSVSLVRQCSQQIRTMSYLLHPPLLDELGLEVAVRDFAEGFSQRSGIPVEIEVSPNLGRLHSDVETALFRIVQECLSNVQRHSGSPDARVRLVAGDAELHLEVSDHGRGISGAVLSEEAGAEETVGSLGVGLRGMRERMHQLGGRLTIDSGTGGTTVRAVLPMRDARAPDS